MTGKKPTLQKQLSLLEVKTKTAPCVPAIRVAVKEWKKRGYPGITDTTRQLLNFWFIDHRLPNGRNFRYHHCQREAVETIVYLYEVAKIRRHKELLEKFSPSDVPDLRLLQYDDFTRYCIKMATGSGKTKVMSLLVAWQYFNAILEGKNDYAKVFLIIAPNVIVFERLKIDFQGGHIFVTDPIIPPDFKIYWNANFDFYVRGDGERASSQGALYLTNIQQFYDRHDNDSDKEPEPMTAVLGPRPPANNQEIEDFGKRIAARSGPCMVINDEAHHTHDEGSEWNEVIRRLHSQIPGGLCSQMDFSATPRYSKGSLFTWTIYDYPLKQAILDNIVKRPIKGIATGIEEASSDIASTRYAAYLAAGVERWKEYQERLKSLNKKPILFIMMNSTDDAEDVADYLRDKYPEFFAGDKLQVIHTDKTGEVSKKELDNAR